MHLPYREGVLDDMARNGVECVDCLSVDNALVRLGDPLFAGYCHEMGAECGALLFALFTLPPSAAVPFASVLSHDLRPSCWVHPSPIKNKPP